MSDFIANTIQAHIATYNSESREYLYLALQRADNVIPYPGIWQVVTGTIEDGETAVETTIRELKEETSLEFEKMFTLPYIASFFMPRRDKICFVPVFGFIVNEKSKVIISNEHKNYQWMTYEDCNDILVLPSHREGQRIFKEYILEKQDTSDKDMFILMDY